MKWSTKIARIAGIDVFVHASFLLILAWAAFAGWSQGGTLGAVVWTLAFVLALFVCVVLHELGHALAARRYGVGTKDITLLPIGGVARLERIPEDPGQEVVVAIAGPAINVAIAGVLGAWLWLTQGVAALGGINDFFQQLLFVNLALVAFNLIPAFPLDGGRVLRALLARRMERTRATEIAARVGQGFAVLFGIVGLFVNIFLAVIAVFIWFGAAQESGLVRLRGALGDATVENAMLTTFRTLDAEDSIGMAAGLALSGVQRDFPVVLRGTLIGLLRHSDLLRALEQSLSPDAPVHEIMQREVATLQSDERLRDVLPRLAAVGEDAFPVVWRGQLVGLLTKDTLAHYVRFATSARRQGPIAFYRGSPMYTNGAQK